MQYGFARNFFRFCRRFVSVWYISLPISLVLMLGTLFVLKAVLGKKQAA